LTPVLIEKANWLGGTTCDSYGLIWIGDNHLMRAAGGRDSREKIIDYMTFLGGGEISESRMVALVDRSPEMLRFFEKCGIRFQLTHGIVDNYSGLAPGAGVLLRATWAEPTAPLEPGRFST
jgi:3-oxosteroid 1-dehydrogenase